MVSGAFDTVFNWDYEETRARLLTLYAKGKQKQWDSQVRIDWSLDVDPENPAQINDQFNISMFGSPIWQRMTGRERGTFRHHLEAWRVSQFLHGEQGALVCAAKIVQTAPDIDSKFYAATQVIDEARHVETYARYLREKIQLAYPINPSLQVLLAQVITDARWDFTYLGMQVLIEGLALAAFGQIREVAENPLASSINAYIMQDEARHVAFGRLALRDFYPQLTQAERDEREEFVVEASYLMRDRLAPRAVYERLGLPVEECLEAARRSPIGAGYRRALFSRIVPIVRDIGLWGPRGQRAYLDMGVLHFADVDIDRLSSDDERIAEAFPPRSRVFDSQGTETATR